jgi:hypothetical protein
MGRLRRGMATISVLRSLNRSHMIQLASRGISHERDGWLKLYDQNGLDVYEGI